MPGEDTAYWDSILGDLISSTDIRMTGRLRKGNQIPAIPAAFGTVRRIHGCTKNIMVISYTWKKGAKMAPHLHDTEQISYVVDGRMEVHIGDETFVAEKGDSYTEPRNTLHWLTALEPSTTIEAFYPPRPVFAILEMAAVHNLSGAFENISKSMDASSQS